MIIQNGKKQRVCKLFLTKLFQVTNYRMRTVPNISKTGAEKRRSHKNRRTKFPSETWKIIKEHWATFSHKKSHYWHKKTEKKFYDNVDLNVKILHELFKEYSELKTGEKCTMKFKTYHKFFRPQGEFSFRSLKTDACDFCTKCSVKFH